MHPLSKVPRFAAWTTQLKMLATVVAKMPAGNAGLCVDRQDMVGTINPHADDGITLYQFRGKPKVPVAGRSTFTSHRLLMDELGPTLNAAGKGIMLNAHTSRMVMQHPPFPFTAFC